MHLSTFCRVHVSPTDSEEERIAVETASRYGTKPDVYSSPIAEDVSVEVRMDGEALRMGADAHLTILVKNQSSQPRRTTLHSQVAVMYYTGVLRGTIKKEQILVELSPHEGWTVLKFIVHKLNRNINNTHLRVNPTSLAKKQSFYLSNDWQQEEQHLGFGTNLNFLDQMDKWPIPSLSSVITS